uniref:Phosphofructokinase domain-containing protein n=1 Tax=Aureoumbra lagunensis TaxID=44058 RepID=A0A7S3JRG8_9STRA
MRETSHNIAGVSVLPIRHLSELGFESQKVSNTVSFGYVKYISEDECVLGDIVLKESANEKQLKAYVRAGPRAELFFNPKKARVAIVSCGGLCPGMNSIIKNLVTILYQGYGVSKVYGIQGGYRGFTSKDWDEPLELDNDAVEYMHHIGGTVLGTSRGGFDIEKIVSWLQVHHVDQLYVIGGDGTHRGAYKISEECHNRGLRISVAGIPKTIDNDIGLIDRSFGFMTAVSEATRAIAAARVEATCNKPNGIGIVKLMGRSAGFLAAYATLASQDVDLCLVPEIPIVLHGPHGILSHIDHVLEQKGHAVIVVAEGAGEELLGESTQTDAGGNRLLPPIGEFLTKQIKQHFQESNREATVKYIDPSYMVRSVPADASDSYMCMTLAHAAAHGCMAGFTGFTVGLINNRTVMVPIPALAKSSPRSMNANGRTWERVQAITGQPNPTCSPDCTPSPHPPPYK